MMHLFPESVYSVYGQEIAEISNGRTPFTDPFRYIPHPLVSAAAASVMEMIGSSDRLSALFDEGKMLGILVVKDSDGHIGYLAGFSGNVGGHSTIEGFVPPIYDLTVSDGHYRTREAEISEINGQIRQLTDGKLMKAEKELSCAIASRDKEITALRERKASLTKESPDYISQSQFINAEIKRAKDRWKTGSAEMQEKVSSLKKEIDGLKRRRAAMSDELQRWIFGQYVVHNAKGSKASILEIFQEKALMPPGGTGECAAPKLLNHAYLHGLQPIVMGEFWYGESPSTAVRTHGHFYPSCTSKCGPLLTFMLQGLDVSCSDLPVQRESIRIVYEDADLIAVCKPSGMPSVPGLDGRMSLQEMLGEGYLAVHRLDMDTSGIILFAKTPQAEADLKKQFEERTIRKTYMARLCQADSHKNAAGTQRSRSDIAELKTGDKGWIELPLGPDYDERPRQKVDPVHGKPALTEYEVTAINPDGTADIIFHPHTGRTHQLRVHSAHILGLGRPISGDLLYGGCNGENHVTHLHLHASCITFRHPRTKQSMTLECASQIHPVNDIR